MEGMTLGGAGALLPTGTVTFLFTDVEGSTRLLQQHGSEYRSAIARHHEILRDAVVASRGVVFETVGDAVYAAFARVDDAASTAVRAQRELASETFATGPVRVRMGIHLGDVELTADRRHYFGPALYRCARLMAAGHGGQILVSSAAAAILGDNAATGVALRDLGEHRLKDLLRAERVYQLEAEGLEARFPPLATLDARPNNLPVQRTPLVGRLRELAEARALLLDNETRLLTFLGPGGIGKTRLSLELAADASDAFDHGVFFVPLARVEDPSLVANAVARALVLRDAPGRELADTIGDYLRGKRVLLLLDNFEHLLGAAELVGRLLDGAAGVRVLATSQAALRVYGEREYWVPTLGLPDGARDPAALERSEAVRLFVQRARDVRRDLDVSGEIGAIAEVCARLDGLPLAIELAAARVRTLTPAALLARLERTLPLLTGGARDAPARQRTLRDAISWSHDLLDERERTLFRRLSVFNGGATVDTIEAVVAFGSLDPAAVIETVEALASKSLIRVDGGRASMLAVIREFAGERLEAAGEAEIAGRRHAEHYLAVADRSDQDLHAGDELAALARLDAEADNMRAALTWTAANDRAVGLRLAAKLGFYWFLRANVSESRHWYGLLLPARASIPARDEAWALCMAAFFAAEARDAVTADRLGRDAIARAREVGDPRVLSWVLSAATFTLSGEVPSAPALTAEAITVAEASGDRWYIGFTQVTRGEWLRATGEDAAALRAYARALEIGREIGSRFLMVLALLNPAHIHLRRGDVAVARSLFEESHRLALELRDDWTRVYSLFGLGGVAVAEGNAERGAVLLGAAYRWFEERGMRIQDPDRDAFDRYVESARAALDDAAFARAWDEGRHLSLDEALSIALQGSAPPYAPANGDRRPR